MESLDLVVPDKRHFEVLWNALEDLVFMAQSELHSYISTSQHLHSQWMMVLNKDWEEPLCQSEWTTLTENLPVKKSFLSSVFKQASDEDDLLLFDETCLLLEQLRPPEDPIVKLWKELVSTDPVPIDSIGIVKTAESLSPVALLSFVRSQQKRFHATMEQVTDLIHLLNQQMSPDDSDGTTKDRLTKSRFLSWMASDSNDIMDSPKGTSGSQDMTQPLSHYWIYTAHDTYRSSRTTNDVLQYTNALYRGVRCLELDLEDDDQQDPVVGGTLAFHHVLRAIRIFLNQFPQSYPILLKFEYTPSLSTTAQLKIANLLYEYFGAANLLVTLPEAQNLMDSSTELPTPASMRGKLLVCGKRPRVVRVDATVLHDDLDAHLRKKDDVVADTNDTESILDEDEAEARGAVVGFDAEGPIRHTTGPSLAPETLFSAATEEAARALAEKEEMDTLKRELWKQVDAHEELTASLTQQAGLNPVELKRRAARARDDEEEKEKDNEEGFEVHEVLNSAVVDSQDAYAVAAQESMEAAQRTAERGLAFKDAEQSLRDAERALAMSKQMEVTATQNVQRAHQEARMYQEHAVEARDRVDRVRDLLKDSKSNATSAGSVVQTALTEAKISEKRASEAESRAQRAKAAAQQDRARADLDTRREETLEQEVSALHIEVQEVEDSLADKASQLEKSQAMLERNNEQIKLIESSSQYRKELMESAAAPEAMRHTASFLSKHQVKLDERISLRDTIWAASQEITTIEARSVALRNKLEEQSIAWRAQATVANQARRTADRSAAVANELVENAEEEREAAELRLTACEKAVATVENRGSHRLSVEAQLAEAERAAFEAEDLAQQSKTRAGIIETEAINTKDHTAHIDEVVRAKWELKQALQAYESAKEAQRLKDDVTTTEKRRLDTNSSVYQTAKRSAKTEGVRIKIVQVIQQEAIVAYNTTLMLRDQAEDAVAKSDAAAIAAEEKQKALELARRYKARHEVTKEIPSSLAKSTYVHFARFHSWKKSFSLSNAYAHCFTFDRLQKMVAKAPLVEPTNFQEFTKFHLCRAIPPNSTDNPDPILPWSLGVQLVATNLSSAATNHEPVLITDGRFRENGSCGYVLKPEFLLNTSSAAPTSEKWSITILSGYNIPKTRRNVGPRVQVSVYSGKGKPASWKTPHGSNPIYPVWKSDNKFSFTVPVPALAVVALSVWDESAGTLLGAAAVPVHCIRQGYRSVSLFDRGHARTGPLCYASLFVKASKH